MTNMSRRNALGTIAVGAAAVAVPLDAGAQTPIPSATVPAFAGSHAPKPLSFDATKLTGLSEKLIRSHWENNYQGSVKALNMVEGRLSAAMADKDLPPVIYGDLKREELHRTGSVILHELYFEQFGGDGVAKGTIREALAKSHGNFEAWEAEFRRTAMALAGGSGWCILAWNQYTKSLHNYWAWDHTNGPVAGTPLLVLDMYEHAFAIDYGAAAAKYVEAFMHNIDWAVVDARYKAAARLKLEQGSAMRGFTHGGLIAFLALGGCTQAQPSVQTPFTLEREIILPDVKGRIDHLALDVAHHRLFVAEIANGSVDTVNLASGQLRRITGLAEPQGVAYLPGLDQLVVASGGDGTVRFFNAATLMSVGSLKLGSDADNVRVDKASGLMAVGYGAGAIALIDPVRREVVRTIPLPAHPEGFQIDAAKGRLYVNLPNAGAVAAVDLAEGTVLARWRAPHHLNFPMALGAEGQTLAIVSRLPAYLSMLDAASGAVHLDPSTCGDADDVFRDARRKRWYVSCGSGKVEAFSETASPLGFVKTGSCARTSLYSPDLDRLIVAVPAGWTGGSARLLVLKPEN